MLGWVFVCDLMGKEKHNWVDQLCLVALAEGMNGLMVHGLKNWVNEPRPDGAPYSFPSGHTCASIGAALAMYPFLERKWGIPLVILAVLISLSRLYVGVHYPTDVLGGAVVGAFAAWGAVRIVKHGLVRKAKKAEK